MWPPGLDFAFYQHSDYRVVGDHPCLLSLLLPFLELAGLQDVPPQEQALRSVSVEPHSCMSCSDGCFHSNTGLYI